MRPIEQQLGELKTKIINMEHVEEIAQKVEKLKMKLAWSWVYKVDRQLQEQIVKIEQAKGRIPTFQDQIDSATVSYKLGIERIYQMSNKTKRR